LAFKRLVVDADEHSMARRIVLDFVEKDSRMGRVARVNFRDRPHLVLPIDAFDMF
jgi:hypothetical protein